MFRFATDEDFDNDIVRGVRLRRPGIDLARAQDAGLSGSPDDRILEWAVQEDRVLLTHDASTMTAHVARRIRAGLSVPKVVVSPQRLAIGEVINAICRLDEEADPSLFGYPIRFLPLPEPPDHPAAP